MTDTQTPAVPAHRWLIVSVAIIAVVLVAAVVILALAGTDAAAIAASLAAAAGAFGLLAGPLLSMLQETRQQTNMLAEIHDNTNGKLDARIRNAVRQEMDAAPAPPDPAQLEAERIAAVEARGLAALTCEQCGAVYPEPHGEHPGTPTEDPNIV